jgi:hypothetical protein
VADFDDETRITPDGLTIRRRRRRLGVSRRDFLALLEARTRTATGIAETLPRSVLRGIEESNERVAYATLCLIALGLDCNPIELLQGEGTGGRLTLGADPRRG